MMNRRRQSLARKQHGFLLITLLALLVMGGLYFFISNLTPEAIATLRKAKTDAALVQAREALVGYAVRYREDQINDGQLDRVYGYLPLPDLGSSRNNNVDPKCKDAGNNPLEGCDAASNTTNHTVIGRFPWRTLGTEPLRDGNGECLWYVVSGSHDRIQRPEPMNWDTLGQIDLVIADGTSTLASALASAHDRPVAIIFAPGPPLAGQNRADSTTDNVANCGGNYDAINYLDPATAGSLGTTSNYFAGATNNAAGDTGTTPKALSAGGTIERKSDSTLWANTCPQGSSCNTVANDRGLTLTNDALFGVLRKSSSFRLDINSMLDRMVSCLRDEVFAAGGSLSPPYGKITGADNNACYGKVVDPRGYYPNYREMIFVAAPGSATVTVDGVMQPSCAGALIFANQRKTDQRRSTTPEKTAFANYLEDIAADNIFNLTNFTGSGTVFSGYGQFARIPSFQPPVLQHPDEYKDIVRCIPAGKSFKEAPSALPAGRELAAYDAATRTLTLGRQDIDTAHSYAASSLFGCAWTPETHGTGSGVRVYFKFRIEDTGSPGEGFTFAAVDGDRNSTTVCGAARQHLGYSGNNGSTSPIAYPKLGIEFDTRRNYRDAASYGYTFTDPTGFFPGYTGASPASTSYLNNGRADPDYTGGHMAIVYWGGETRINTGLSCGWWSSCTAPQFCAAGTCYLNPEEDDNVHGRTASPPATRPPPQNPVAQAAPPAPPAGVYKLDPSLSQVPVNQDIHIRVEIDRVGNAGRDDHSKRVRVVATTNLPVPLSGLPTIDSIALAAGNRVLVVAQTDPKWNGVWLASAGNWTRASTENEGTDLPAGSSWFVMEGTANRGSLWRLQNADPVVVNFSSLTIALFRRPVRAVTTANLTLAGLQTIGGVSLVAGDRVLLAGQTNPKDNGVYDVASGGWSRSSFESTAAGMKAGSTWYVTEGASAGTFWHTTADASPGGSAAITIGNVAAAPNTIYYSTFKTQVWKPSSNNASQITKMQVTTRPLSLLDPTHQPLLYDLETIYDIRGNACNSTLVCSSGESCGIDNYCYSPAFRTMRLGFTNSQSSRDQNIDITNFATTWLP
jgi:hypothetical protein